VADCNDCVCEKTSMLLAFPVSCVQPHPHKHSILERKLADMLMDSVYESKKTGTWYLKTEVINTAVSLKGCALNRHLTCVIVH